MIENRLSVRSEKSNQLRRIEVPVAGRQAFHPESLPPRNRDFSILF
jgi:hypothetical protein